MQLLTLLQPCNYAPAPLPPQPPPHPDSPQLIAYANGSSSGQRVTRTAVHTQQLSHFKVLYLT